MYSIKAVSQATGLSVETLRAWERRYAIVAPKRDASGRRVYGPDDVGRLRRLREATERGHPISRLAGLAEDELLALLHEPPARETGSPAPSFVARILDAALRYRADECEQLLTLAAATLPQQQLIGEMLEPLLREVGDRWHRGELSIAQERLVSGCVRKHVALLLDIFDRCARRQVIVFATLSDERHELGLLMSAMVCASRGFKCRYLGPDLPPGEIARAANGLGAAVVALSVVMRDGLDETFDGIAELVAQLDPRTALWIGGSAASALPAGALPARCAIITDPPALERQLDMLAAA